jgi:glycosyltransferase involved in cell wall biosynthesis
MRLLIVSAAYPPNVKGGGEVSTGLLASKLASAGHEVNVLTISDAPSHDIIEGVAVKRIVSPNIYWNFNTAPSRGQLLTWHLLENYNPDAIKLVKKHIADINPDLIVTSTTENFGTSVWLAAKKKHVPVIHILRSYNTMCSSATMYRHGHNCQKTCAKCDLLSAGKRYASHAVSGVIGLSKHVLAAHINNGYFKHAIPAVLPNFIPDAIVERAKRTQKENIQRSAVFGYFGILTKQKGLEPLIAAFKNVANKEEFSAIQLVIGGSGEASYMQELQSSLEGYNAKFLGWVNQDDILPHIDYLIIPSLWHEPLGRVVLEAFSYGLPVIGSSRGGIPDMIQEGLNGYLFEPDDPYALTTILEMLADKPDYDVMSANALETLNAYSEKTMLPQYIDYFKSCLVEQI